MLWRDTICLLGIPVDRVTAGEALGRILDMLQRHGEDRRPRLVTTLTADFMSNALSGWSLIPRNQELLQTLRQADLVLATGRPLRWLCARLGTPLPGGISSQVLVLSLAREAARRGRSIYLLGSSPEVTAQVKLALAKNFPALHFAGVDACAISAGGEEDVETAVDDGELLERINRSGADLLLLGFGNPAQELWFRRNRDRLQVPVTIGIGYAFSEVGGRGIPAPEWMRHKSLAWLRLPTRSAMWFWRRYVRDVSDFVMLAGPVILLSRGRLRRLLFPGRFTAAPSLTRQLHRLSDGTHQVAVLELPASVTDEQVRHSDTAIVERAFAGDGLVVEANALTFVDAAGLGFLFSLLRECEAKGKYFHLIAPASVRRLLTLNRAWDIFAPYFCASYEEMILRVEGHLGREFCYCGTKQEEKFQRVWAFGRFNAATAPKLAWLVQKAGVSPADTVLDMAACVFVDSDGLALLDRLANALRQQGRRLILIRVQPPLLRLLRNLRQEGPLESLPDLAAAKAALGVSPEA